MGSFEPANRVPQEVELALACSLRVAAARLDGPDGPPSVALVVGRYLCTRDQEVAQAAVDAGTPLPPIEACVVLRSVAELDDLIRVLRDCAAAAGLR